VGEECDDGNTQDGDGCSADCQNEDTFPQRPGKQAVCGDEYLDEGEDCDDSNNEGGDGCDASCKYEDGGVCPLGHGEWKDGADWPISELALGGVTYDQPKLLEFLATEAGQGGGEGSDASLVLAYQLITALLNSSNGTVVFSPVATAIADASALLEGCAVPCNVDPNSELGHEMIEAASVLRSFNSGELNPVCTPAS
jgi:cysteine-rich repeat protein